MSKSVSKTILIIDDSEDAILLATRILESDGVKIIPATTVADGIARIRKDAPHLVLTDLDMPVENGFDFLKKRKTDETLARVPVIVLSGLNDPQSVARAISLGAADYLLKPFRPGLLLQKTRKALRAVSFLSFSFAPDERPSLRCSVPADIVAADETGVRLSSPLRLSPDEEVWLASGFLDNLGCGKLIKRTGHEPAKVGEKGTYLSEVQFVGLNETAAKRIRAGIKGM